MEVTTIYNQFHAQLLSYIRSKIRSREDAEDILQNVFIRISSGVDKLSEDEKLKNWVFTITRNAVIDYYRSHAGKKNIRTTVAIDEGMAEGEIVDATKGLEQCIGTMIALLPEEYRDIITEAEINGVKQKDLAERYGIAYPSLRSRVQRGRERLKQLFYNCCHIKTDSLGNIIEAQGRSTCSGPCSPYPEE